MKALRPIVLAVAFALPAIAVAQYQWLDKDGRKVFSDRPPPSDIAPNRILKQPGKPAAAPTEGASAEGDVPGTKTAAATPQAGASAPKLNTVDKDLEAKKKQKDAETSAKQKEADAKVAQAKADNCGRAKQSKASFESGARMARVNAQGEREFLDDNQRAAETKRLEEIIARDCK